MGQGEISIDEELFILKKKMEDAKEVGTAGRLMCHRIESDLKRIMSSGYLNLQALIDENAKTKL